MDWQVGVQNSLPPARMQLVCKRGGRHGRTESQAGSSIPTVPRECNRHITRFICTYIVPKPAALQVACSSGSQSTSLAALVLPLARYASTYLPYLTRYAAAIDGTRYARSKRSIVSAPASPSSWDAGSCMRWGRWGWDSRGGSSPLDYSLVGFRVLGRVCWVGGLVNNPTNSGGIVSQLPG